MSKSLTSKTHNNEETWISVSDMMAGLMMVFLLIAIIYSKDANQRADNVSEIVTEWRDSELKIYNALYEEFKHDLPKWNAEIENKTLTIRFNAPEILFNAGSAEISDQFKLVLQDFMPRYIWILKYQFDEKIDEVRIEGHTSSEWSDGYSTEQAFIENMKLSQARTRTVLGYSLSLPELFLETEWMTKKVSANGLSSAKLIFTDGEENKSRSRRVEFTIKTKTKDALFRVLNRVSTPLEEVFE